MVWRDDAQIVTQLGRKRYGVPERCEVVVQEFGLALNGPTSNPLHMALAAALRRERPGTRWSFRKPDHLSDDVKCPPVAPSDTAVRSLNLSLIGTRRPPE